MEKKEIQYIDKSYEQKRKILRRYHFVNPEVFELSNMVKYKVLKNIKDSKFVDNGDVIDTLLIDGYVAYEKIFKDDKVVSLVKLDTLSFSMEVDNGSIVWHQNRGKNNSRILSGKQVLYVKSPNLSYTSFVEMVYLNVINKNSKYSIKYYINELVDCYNINFLNIS